MRMPPKEVLLKLEEGKARVKYTGDQHETLGWGWGGEGVAGTLSFGSQTTPKAMYSMGGKKFVDIAGGRRHTLLVSEEGVLYACGENKGGVLGNSGKVLGMSKQFEKRRDMLRKRPMKWFPSPTVPSGHIKGGSDFKIGQVVCTDGASFAREVCPEEGELSVEALTKMIKSVEKMINNCGGDR